MSSFCGGGLSVSWRGYVVGDERLRASSAMRYATPFDNMHPLALQTDPQRNTWYLPQSVERTQGRTKFATNSPLNCFATSGASCGEIQRQLRAIVHIPLMSHRKNGQLSPFGFYLLSQTSFPFDRARTWNPWSRNRSPRMWRSAMLFVVWKYFVAPLSRPVGKRVFILEPKHCGHRNHGAMMMW